MNRTHFQQLAEERVRDAAALLAANQWSAAYYLAGYAVECGLKACVAKLTREHDFPDNKRVQKSYTHKIDTLVEVAGLEGDRQARAQAFPKFLNNWLIARDWDENARYELWTEHDARQLFDAVTEPTNGVLPWIVGHW